MVEKTIDQVDIYCLPRNPVEAALPGMKRSAVGRKVRDKET